MSELYDYIDRYFNAEMTEKEKGEFENRCSSDTAFAEKIAVYAAMHDHLQQKNIQWKEQQVRELEKEDFFRDDVVEELLDNVFYGGDKVYKEFFERDRTPEHPPELLEEAFDYYNLEEYADAIDAFNNINTDNLVVTRSSAQDQELVTFYKFYFKG